jgi:hypothetical protein
MRNTLTLAIMAISAVIAFEAAAVEQSRYSQAVQQTCVADYKKYCGEYGIETEALRLCMDKNGESLTKTCVQALVDAGEVSQADIDKRKKAKR